MTSLNNYSFPSLETERLLLRPIVVEDTDFVFRHFSNPAVTQYLLDEPPVTDYAQAEEIVQFYVGAVGKPYNRWAIVRKSDNQPIGTCGYHKWDRHNIRSEIGYDLNPDFWGQAYMTEALKAAISEGYRKMGLNRIEALVCVENVRSVRLLQKLGFKQEGVLRDYYYFNDTFSDHYLFSLIRKEWQP